MASNKNTLLTSKCLTFLASCCLSLGEEDAPPLKVGYRLWPLVVPVFSFSFNDKAMARRKVGQEQYQNC